MIEPLLTSSGNNSRLIMIEQQCDSDDCIKVADYFDVYKYHGNNSRFDKGRLIGRIKAYVWHDVR
jgi:hypothetical protein